MMMFRIFFAINLVMHSLVKVGSGLCVTSTESSKIFLSVGSENDQPKQSAFLGFSCAVGHSPNPKEVHLSASVNCRPGPDVSTSTYLHALLDTDTI